MEPVNVIHMRGKKTYLSEKGREHIALRHYSNPAPERIRHYQTARRARPFALRRAKTFRPFFVLIRLRNPCSRFRFNLEGCWNVKDIALSFVIDAQTA